MTWKHEKVIQAVFEAGGYRCVILPVPNVAAFQLGKEYGNNGQCNPTYFTVGNLVQYLQGLEARGMSRQEIIDKHVFFREKRSYGSPRLRISPCWVQGKRAARAEC